MQSAESLLGSTTSHKYPQKGKKIMIEGTGKTARQLRKVKRTGSHLVLWNKDLTAYNYIREVIRDQQLIGLPIQIWEKKYIIT